MRKGGVRAASEDVRYAEFVGAGGVEGYFDERLRDPARLGAPLELSIDLTVQAALRDVLAAGMAQFTAKGAMGVLMDVRTGELVAIVSLPDFDPNREPERFTGAAELNPRFNRAVQGRYELGSTFKVLTAAFALDAGVVGPETLIEGYGYRCKVVECRLGAAGFADRNAAAEGLFQTAWVLRCASAGTGGSQACGTAVAAKMDGPVVDDDFVWPRDRGLAGASGCRIRNIGERRQAGAADTDQGRRRARRAGFLG
jgi:hypothetical protein